jgi:hypothetical protein
VRLDATAEPRISVGEGAWAAPLYSDEREHVTLQIWEPGARIRIAGHDGLEALVLEGGFEEGGEAFVRHSWLRLPPDHGLIATAGRDGAVLWMKTDHLRP